MRKIVVSISVMILITIHQSKLCSMFKELPFVILVCSYNNSQWYERNLSVVFAQKYSNYRVIYIDDCSTDNTAQLVQDYIIKHGQQHRCTLIKNKTRKLKTQNMYDAIHRLCLDHEIILEYDGDDWLAHDEVLSKLNEVYTSPNVWIAYSQHKYWPDGDIGWGKMVPQDIIIQNRFRKYIGFLSQIRTFYAWLFKRIKKQDLICIASPHRGKFYPTNADVAMMFPMLEMAGERFRFIPEVLYHYNRETPLRDVKTKKQIQLHYGKEIRRRKRYKRLPRSPFEKKSIRRRR